MQKTSNSLHPHNFHNQVLNVLVEIRITQYLHVDFSKIQQTVPYSISTAKVFIMMKIKKQLLWLS